VLPADFGEVCEEIVGDALALIPYLESEITERETIGRRLVVAGIAPDKTIGASSIQPLITLGLLAADPAEPHRSTVSARGRSTWEHFLESGGRYPEDLISF
jgi:hypothetical protein